MTERTITQYQCDRCLKVFDTEKAIRMVSVNVQILDAAKYPGVHFRWEHLCHTCHEAALVYFKEAKK